jgi:hypothetical protein
MRCRHPVECPPEQWEVGSMSADTVGTIQYLSRAGSVGETQPEPRQSPTRLNGMRRIRETRSRLGA